MRVFELRGQAVETVGFLKRGQVLALDVFDQRQLEGFRVVGDLFDAGHLAQPRRAGSVVAALAGDDVIALFARDIADEQRLQHTLLADRLRQFAQISQRFARLVRVRANFFDRNHPADRRPAVGCQRFNVVRVMPHLQRDGQPDPLGHVG